MWIHVTWLSLVIRQKTPKQKYNLENIEAYFHRCLWSSLWNHGRLFSHWINSWSSSYFFLSTDAHFIHRNGSDHDSSDWLVGPDSIKQIIYITFVKIVIYKRSICTQAYIISTIYLNGIPYNNILIGWCGSAPPSIVHIFLRCTLFSAVRFMKQGFTYIGIYLYQGHVLTSWSLFQCIKLANMVWETWQNH